MDISPVFDQSVYLKGRQCFKLLYLSKNSSHLATPEVSTRPRTYNSNHDIKKLFRSLFPSGVNMGRNVETTMQYIRSGKEDILYNAAFNAGEKSCWADMLVREGESWQLVRVKAVTGVKLVIVEEAAYQRHIIRSCGINISSVNLYLLDNKYVRKGEINPAELFKIADITESIDENYEEIGEKVQKMINSIYDADTKNIPIGSYCFSPRKCDFFSHCWQDIPEESVFTLRGKGINKYELYHNGIARLKDLPLERLSPKQRFQAESTINRENSVDIENLRQFAASISYPLYFLDLETTSFPIPPYEGTKAYQQIPFQFSLHLQKTKGGEVVHHEFLAETGSDPRRKLAELLIEKIDKNGCILVYSQLFEKRMLRELADAFSDLEPQLSALNKNIIDLAEPFRKRDLYYWQMHGSYSLKHVLPAVVPGLDYKEMDIGNGREAVDAYGRLAQLTDPKERADIKNALLEYCKLDTYAMVKILEKIEQIVAKDARNSDYILKTNIPH